VKIHSARTGRTNGGKGESLSNRPLDMLLIYLLLTGTKNTMGPGVGVKMRTQPLKVAIGGVAT